MEHDEGTGPLPKFVTFDNNNTSELKTQIC